MIGLGVGWSPCVVYDLETEAVDVLVKEGAIGARSLEDFAEKLKNRAPSG